MGFGDGFWRALGHEKGAIVRDKTGDLCTVGKPHWDLTSNADDTVIRSCLEVSKTEIVVPGILQTRSKSN